jgi:hypothetical protein
MRRPWPSDARGKVGHLTMMDIGTIRAIARKAARDSAAAKIEPFELDADDVSDLRAKVAGDRPMTGPLFPFPFIGSRTPKGWRKIDSWFVDTSGWGAPNEPALTPRQLAEKLKPGLGYALTEVGEFQGYLGVFERRKSA